MENSTPSQRTEEQASFFETLASLFPIPDTDAKQTRSRKRRNPQGKTHAEIIAECQQTLDLWLDILNEPDFADESEWTDQHIQELRAWMLTRHLQMLLYTRLTEATMRECWDWVMDASEQPFGFDICVMDLARCLGLADETVSFVDPHEVRLAFLGMAQMVGRTPTHFCAIRELPVSVKASPRAVTH